MGVISRGDYRRMPWKNGGGETTEIAVSPEDASLDTFDWRISMATVVSDGAFSLFHGIDRTLCVLEGHGLDLDFAGPGEVRITLDTPPFAFPADNAASARLISGTVQDLNVMTRRDRFRHRVSRMRVATPIELTLAREVLILMVRASGAAIRTGHREWRAEDGDTVVLHAAECISVNLHPDSALDLYVIDLWRV